MKSLPNKIPAALGSATAYATPLPLGQAKE